MSRTALTRRPKALLGILTFRAAGETAPERQHCWLLRDRGRWLLVGPSMVLGEWGSLQYWSEATVQTLVNAGLIVRGPEQDLPAHIARRGLTRGVTVQLTQLPAPGRA